MKICPKCNQTFSDDNSFCLMDGSTLVLTNETDETLSAFSTGNDAPTQFIPTPVRLAEQPSSSIPGWIYLVMGIMGTALIGLLVFVFVLQDGGKTETAVVKTNDSSENAKRQEKSVHNKPEEKEAIKLNQNAEFKSEIKQPPKPSEVILYNSPSGNWSGDWNSKTTSFRSTASFNESNGNIDGQINWNLIRTTNPKKINKVGSSATEYVSGTFNPKTGKISLKGYRKDDPQNIVILDRYNLYLSKDNQQMKGRTINGNFVLRR